MLTSVHRLATITQSAVVRNESAIKEWSMEIIQLTCANEKIEKISNQISTVVE